MLVSVVCIIPDSMEQRNMTTEQKTFYWYCYSTENKGECQPPEPSWFLRLWYGSMYNKPNLPA